MGAGRAATLFLLAAALATSTGYRQPAVPLSYNCTPPDAEKVLSIGMHSGLNNQRWCVLAALATAAKLNYTFILPSWRMDYHKIQLPACATRPFGYFYQLAPLQRWARSRGFRIARAYTDIDPDQLGACFQSVAAGYRNGERYFNSYLVNGTALPTTLCLNSKDTVLQLVRLFLPLRAARSLPVLQHPHVHYVGRPALQEVRAALIPRRRFANEVDKIVANIRAAHGVDEFVSVHVRIEDDWAHAVTVYDPWVPGRLHWVGEALVARQLEVEHGVPRGTLLLVCSGTPVAELPALCGPGAPYRCVDFLSHWQQRDPSIVADMGRETLAFLSFWTAMQGVAFFGTIASSFSIELHEQFQLAGKPAAFYNPYCEGVEACRGNVPP